MKKCDFKKLAILGLAGGLLLTNQIDGADATQNKYPIKYSSAKSKGSEAGRRAPSRSRVRPQKQMNESDLLSQLSKQGRALYSSLTPEGKKLALELANQSCEGKNGCKGLNSCKSDENSCAGEGGCQGKSPGPFHNKNEAVAIAAQHMAKQRLELSQQMLHRGMDKVAPKK